MAQSNFFSLEPRMKKITEIHEQQPIAITYCKHSKKIDKGPNPVFCLVYFLGYGDQQLLYINMQRAVSKATQINCLK